MFCLFKNSKLYPRINFYLVAISWVAVLYWLHFSFIEKALVTKVLSGDAVMVDLLFGLPLVLMLAVVVYATLYWFMKLCVIYLYPQAIMPAELDEDSSQISAMDDSLENEQARFGDQYWEHEEGAQPQQKGDSSDPSVENTSSDNDLDEKSKPNTSSNSSK